MRISTQQIFASGLNGILDAQQRLENLQKQIASAKRFETPADDPIAAARAVAIKEQLALTAQYRKNADTAKGRLGLEETTLKSINEALLTVRDLALHAGDGALNLADRQAIAAEVRQRLNQLLGLVNTKDANNQYLFSGYQSGQKSFVPAPGGGYSYQGDDGQLLIRIADSIDIPVSESGKALFQNVNAPLDFSATPNAGNSGTGLVANQAVLNQEDFNAFHPDGATVTFSLVGAVTSYTVTRVSDGAVINGGGPPPIPLSGIPYVPGAAIEFEGMHISVTGAPDDGDSIDIASQPQQKLDMLGIVEKLVNGLETLGNDAADTLRRGELIADTLIGIDNAQHNILQAQARIGAKLNTIEDTMAGNEDLTLLNRQALSELEDLDYADALSKLSQQSFILQAAQQTFVRITGLSLFNLLK